MKQILNSFTIRNKRRITVQEYSEKKKKMERVEQKQNHWKKNACQIFEWIKSYGFLIDLPWLKALRRRPTTLFFFCSLYRLVAISASVIIVPLLCSVLFLISVAMWTHGLELWLLILACNKKIRGILVIPFETKKKSNFRFPAISCCAATRSFESNWKRFDSVFIRWLVTMLITPTIVHTMTVTSLSLSLVPSRSILIAQCAV